MANNNSKTPTIIGADAIIKGNFSSKGEMQIDGVIEGNISVGDMVIGKSASIVGDINAKQVLLSGHVTGNIKAENIEVKASGSVKGNLVHSSLSIESGAKISGRCVPAGSDAKEPMVDIKKLSK